MSTDLSVTFCKLLRSLKSVKCIFFSNLDLKAAPCFWLETILLQVTIADTLEKAHLDKNRSYVVVI